VYERAKDALEKCSSIDECAEWKNKAEAIASYARQSEDETLFNLATRIKARAIRRCGQLLKEIESAQGARTDLQPSIGGGTKLTRKQAADEAGLSKRQKDTALRVAAVPPDEFERAVEGEKPPTVTELAERGKKPSTAHLQGRDPADFRASTKAQAALMDLVSVVAGIDAAIAVRGALPHEVATMDANARAAEAWLHELRAELASGALSPCDSSTRARTG
jgi:hypothetical protein